MLCSCTRVTANHCLSLYSYFIIQYARLAPCITQHAPRTMHHAPCTMHHAPCTMQHAPRMYVKPSSMTMRSIDTAPSRSCKPGYARRLVRPNTYSQEARSSRKRQSVRQKCQWQRKAPPQLSITLSLPYSQHSTSTFLSSTLQIPIQTVGFSIRHSLSRPAGLCLMLGHRPSRHQKMSF